MSAPSPLPEHLPLPPLATLTAPLAGVMVTILAVWIMAIPRLDHAVRLQIGGPCAAPLAPPAQIHSVHIDADNAVSWDGTPLANLRALEARLRAIGTMVPARQAGVRVVAHPSADYGAFMAVLAPAQRLGVQRLDIGGEGMLPSMECPASCDTRE